MVELGNSNSSKRGIISLIWPRKKLVLDWGKSNFQENEKGREKIRFNSDHALTH